jgi:hypothetical protein
MNIRAVPTKGERAIRAQQKAARAAAKNPESLNEAVSNKMDEALAKLEARELLQLPENLVSARGETVQSSFRLGHVVDTLKNPNMINISASELRVDLAACVWSGVAEAALDAAESARAENSLEKMLCHQMAAGHCAAMRLTAYSLDNGTPSVERARLSNAAARMMQVYQEAFLTLQKVRSGGKQTVVVQHVQVTEGGQAVTVIAGNVKSGRGGGMMGRGRLTEIGKIPHEKRRGWLKNGNLSGDFSKAARCGAKNRRGTPCQCPAMKNGRCRLHGGLSTGPKTPAGIQRIRQAVTKHGRYSKQAMAEREHYRMLLQQCRETLVKNRRSGWPNWFRWIKQSIREM